VHLSQVELQFWSHDCYLKIFKTIFIIIIIIIIGIFKSINIAIIIEPMST